MTIEIQRINNAIFVKPLTRAERETRAVAALTKKQAFAPGLFGYEREQMALMIVRCVLDCEDGKQ